MQPWWEDMAMVLENSSLADFRHWDMWLGHRQRNGAQPEFKCFEPLGGYGHRASKTQRSGERFGGAWLQAKHSARSMKRKQVPMQRAYVKLGKQSRPLPAQ